MKPKHKRDTLKFLEGIFGKNKVSYYQKEIDKALGGRGKYKNSHGLIHSGIILYINSAEDFISKTMAYETLEAFINGKDEISVENILIPSDPAEILQLAKKYIDDYETKT